MSSTTRIPKAQLTGLYGYLVKRFSRKLLGDVPEPAEVMWHNRPVLSSVDRASAARSQKWDQLDPNLKSFAHMAVAAQVGCSWCLDFGYFHGPQRGTRRGQGQRGAPVARVVGVHAARARRHGVRRGDDRDAAHGSPTSCRPGCSSSSVRRPWSSSRPSSGSPT